MSKSVRVGAVALMLLSTAALGLPQEPPVAYERLLLPVVVSSALPGEYGSSWLTQVTITNGAAEPVSIFPYGVSNVCSACPQQPMTPAKRTFFAMVPVDRTYDRGTFLYVDRAHLSDVQITLMLKEMSRPDTWGTALPVVMEESFSQATIHLNEIPTTTQFRTTIRIYGLEPLDQTAVRLQLYGCGDALQPAPFEDPLLGETEFVLSIPAAPILQPTLFPAYLELRGTDVIGPAANFSRVRLALTPLTPGKRIWAFASVVDNVTQQVTILTPSGR